TARRSLASHPAAKPKRRHKADGTKPMAQSRTHKADGAKPNAQSRRPQSRTARNRKNSSEADGGEAEKNGP
ncbi:MAG TPA: hypothetical protein VFP64_17805, partial [Pyrinomonadaceae bacterium]|nr:hypothetical protein [Pyrinomonadaceae bacterium]